MAGRKMKNAKGIIWQYALPIEVAHGPFDEQQQQQRLRLEQQRQHHDDGDDDDDDEQVG